MLAASKKVRAREEPVKRVLKTRRRKLRLFLFAWAYLPVDSYALERQSSTGASLGAESGRTEIYAPGLGVSKATERKFTQRADLQAPGEAEWDDFEAST